MRSWDLLPRAWGVLQSGRSRTGDPRRGLGLAAWLGGVTELPVMGTDSVL